VGARSTPLFRHNNLGRPAVKLLYPLTRDRLLVLPSAAIHTAAIHPTRASIITSMVWVSMWAMSMVNNATKTTYAFLAEEETTEAAMRLLWGWIERYGIPKSLYCEQKSVYITNREPALEEQLKGITSDRSPGCSCEDPQERGLANDLLL
jgi:hypothetical protein